LNSLKLSLLVSAAAAACRLACGQCVTPPSGILAWWPGEGNANDIIGADNGVLQGAVTFAPGEVGQAFAFDGVQSFVTVPDSVALRLSSSDFTLSAWIFETQRNSDYQDCIVSKRGNGNTNGWFLSVGGQRLSAVTGKLYYQVSGGSDPSSVSTQVLSLNQWHYVVVVYRAASQIDLFIDGVLDSTASGLPMPNPNTTADLHIGDDSDGIGYNFHGKIDEVAIFNRALTSNEVASIYNAGGAGMCRKPFIVSQPQSQIGYWGQSVVFTVAALPNSPPLSYQWQSNGVALPGAANQTLVLTNLQTSNAAAYTVVVSNLYGSVTSTPPANLIINPAGTAIALYSGVTISGVTGYTYGIQASTNLSDTNAWVGLTNLTLTTPIELWYDSVPATRSRRFYRVLAGPIPIP
jgi:hypothetical protein